MVRFLFLVCLVFECAQKCWHGGMVSRSLFQPERVGSNHRMASRIPRDAHPFLRWVPWQPRSHKGWHIKLGHSWKTLVFFLELCWGLGNVNSLLMLDFRNSGCTAPCWEKRLQPMWDDRIPLFCLAYRSHGECLVYEWVGSSWKIVAGLKFCATEISEKRGKHRGTLSWKRSAANWTSGTSTLKTSFLYIPWQR